jgi:type III secretion protein T
VLKGNLRNAIALALALPVAYRLYLDWPAQTPGYLLLAWLAFKEALLGFLVGFLLSLPFWLFQTMGNLIDNQRSVSATQINNPSVGNDASLIGGLILQALIIFAFQSGAMSSLFHFIYCSYQLWPPLAVFPPLEFAQAAIWIDAFSTMLRTLVLYAAPPMIILLLVDLGFAMLSMVAPQLQVSFAAMPIKSLAGLFVLALYAATLWHFAGVQLMGVHDLLLWLEACFPKKALFP